jgi:hypothetical protein
VLPRNEALRLRRTPSPRPPRERGGSRRRRSTLARDELRPLPRDFADRFRHPFRVRPHAMVFDAHHPYAMRRQESVAPFIADWIVMCAVELDRELRARTVEVDDERPERMLTANRDSELRPAYAPPDDLLFWRGVSPKLPRAIKHVLRRKS